MKRNYGIYQKKFSYISEFAPLYCASAAGCLGLSGGVCSAPARCVRGGVLSIGYSVFCKFVLTNKADPLVWIGIILSETT